MLSFWHIININIFNEILYFFSILPSKFNMHFILTVHLHSDSEVYFEMVDRYLHCIKLMVERVDSHIQFSSVTQLCPTLWAPWTAACQASLSIINSQSLPKIISIESVMPSNYLILSSPSPSALNLSQHQGLFQWVHSLHQVAKVLEFQLQHQSFQWTLRTDLL